MRYCVGTKFKMPAPQAPVQHLAYETGKQQHVATSEPGVDPVRVSLHVLLFLFVPRLAFFPPSFSMSRDLVPYAMCKQVSSRRASGADGLPVKSRIPCPLCDGSALDNIFSLYLDTGGGAEFGYGFH